MMAASVIRTGIAETNESTNAIPSSQHSSSMHEPSVSTSSGPSVTTVSSKVVNNNNEDKEGKQKSIDQISSIFSAGKKLAVSSVQGPAASLISSNTSILHEDETDIALSQLKELEVAIEVRKVTRVDGRKTRWIEYRREKKQLDQLKSKKKTQTGKGKVAQKKATFKIKKPAKKIVKGEPKTGKKLLKGSKLKAGTLNGQIEDVEKFIKDSTKGLNNNNIDNTNNNNIKVEAEMKVEVSGPVINPLVTNNVLETMKQQFLQGTVDVPDHATNGLREKTNKKVSRTANGTTSINHLNDTLKRKPGRPKRVEVKGSKISDSEISSKVENSISPINIRNIQNLSSNSESIANSGKKIDLGISHISQSTTDFYSRRNFLTKGLREVRKSESGSESGGSSPIKDGSPSNLSPSPNLALSPIPPLTPIPSESSNTVNPLKCPLITAAAKVLSTTAKKPKATYGLAAKKKKILKKMSNKKENINVTETTNGHESISNGTSPKNANINKCDGKAILRKRGRGRKAKCKTEESLKWMKRTSTVIVDVHNTMNGEPQTVIPVQNPIVLRKKKTPLKVLKSSKLSDSESQLQSEEKTDSKDTKIDSLVINSNKQESLPPVPEVLPNSSLLSSSSPSLPSRKLCNSQSASNVSQIPESGKGDSTNTKKDSDTDDEPKHLIVPEMSPHNTIATNDSISESLPEKENDILSTNKFIGSSNGDTEKLNTSVPEKTHKNTNIKSPEDNSQSSSDFSKKQDSINKLQKSIEDFVKVISPKPNSTDNAQSEEEVRQKCSDTEIKEETIKVENITESEEKIDLAEEKMSVKDKVTEDQELKYEIEKSELNDLNSDLHNTSKTNQLPEPNTSVADSSQSVSVTEPKQSLAKSTLLTIPKFYSKIENSSEIIKSSNTKFVQPSSSKSTSKLDSLMESKSCSLKINQSGLSKDSNMTDSGNEGSLNTKTSNSSKTLSRSNSVNESKLLTNKILQSNQPKNLKVDSPVNDDKLTNTNMKVASNVSRNCTKSDSPADSRLNLKDSQTNSPKGLSKSEFVSEPKASGSKTLQLPSTKSSTKTDSAISHKVTNNKSLQANTTKSSFKAVSSNKDSKSSNTRPVQTQKGPTKTETLIGTKIYNAHPFQPNTSKNSIGIIKPSPKSSFPNRSPKKVNDKIKSKNLNDVIEKLYSPPKDSSELENSEERDNASVEKVDNPTKMITKEAVAEVSNFTRETENVVLDNLTDESQLKNISKEQDVNNEANVEKKKMKSDPNNVISHTDKSGGMVSKQKEKVPRFLKQLFQDEGVQNMLRSVNEEVNSNSDGSTVIDSAPHKLRPKRANENFVSDSPEPDDTLFLQSSKRKKRGTDTDSLTSDESTLNQVQSSDVDSRRQSIVDDAASDSSHGSSTKSLNGALKSIVSNGRTSVESQNLETTRKRKLSGNNSNSNPGIIVGKVLHPPEPKKLKVEVPSSEPSPSVKVSPSEPQNDAEKNLSIEKQKKKPGRPALPGHTKQQKTKAQLIFQLKKQLQGLGIRSENLTIAQMKELIAKARGISNHPNTKSVPPIKIKLTEQERVTKLPQRNPESFGESGNKSQNSSVNERSQVPLSSKLQRTSTVDNTYTPSLDKGLPVQRTKTFSGHGDKPPIKCSSNVASRKVTFGVTTANNSATSAPQTYTQQVTSLVHPLEPSNLNQRGKLRAPGEGIRQSQRTSVRQSEGNYHYRDISLRRFNNFMQIILTPSTTKMKNSLNSRVLRELCEALSNLRRDEAVRMVLLTATGSTFCQGIDLTSLQHPNQETRKKNAENLARGIKDFLRALVQFPKVIVAGVNGNAMGLGVTMLPLFDMVIATDKAEFFLPYAKLGQVPEGGATYTFPNYYGKLQSNKLFLGQKITASQAQQMGLVSESIWPATFQQELLPKVALLASQSTQSMEGTKALMNHHIITKLELSVESECRLLLQQWTSQNFSNLCKRFLDTSEVQLQKPVNLPL